MASCWTRPHRRASVCIELLFLHPGPWGQIGLHAGACYMSVVWRPWNWACLGPWRCMYVPRFLARNCNPQIRILLSSHCFIFLPSYSALRSFVFVSPKPCCGIEILGDQVIISNKRTMAPDSGKQYQTILAKQSSYKSHWAQPSANSGHWQKASKATKRPRDIICQSSTSWNRFCHIVSTKILPCWCRTPVLTGPSHHLVPPDFASGRFITEIGSTFTHFHSVADNQIPMGQSWVGPKGWSQAFLPGVHHDGLTTQTLTVQSRDGLESLPKPPKLNLRTGWLNHVESVEFQKMDKNCT